MFAHCCIALDKLNEAEQCLLSSNEQDRKNKNDEIPGGALGLYLMGFICRRSNRRELAIDYFKRSLQLDSTLWSSIVQLGELGEIFDPSKLFGISMDTAIRFDNYALSPTLFMANFHSNLLFTYYYFYFYYFIFIIVF